MKKCKINCYYVQIDNPTRVRDMAWVPQLKLLSLWKGREGWVDSIEVTADNAPDLKLDDLKLEWDLLLREAKSYDDIAAADIARAPPQP